MSRHSHCFLILSALLAACSGSGTDANGTEASDSMVLTLDTAAGAAGAVTVQVVAVAFEDVLGAPSPNLLRAPQIVTLADPAGAMAALSLRGLPAGDYAAVHWIVAPGSAVVLTAEGATAIELPADLRAAFDVPFAHAGGRGWVDLRHASPLALVQRGARQVAELELVAAPGAGRWFTDETAWVAPTRAGEFTAELGDFGVPVVMAMAASAELTDLEGRVVGRDEFFGSGTDVEILFEGSVDGDGTVVVDRARRGGRSDRPRVIGRITELINDHLGFVMNVHAIVRDAGANRDRIAVANVLADDAEIFWSHTSRRLEFTELRVGDLAKVDYPLRDGATFTAERIEITGPRAGPAQPPVHGRVVSVDVANARFVLGPLGDEPLQWNGQTWTSLDVQVTATTALLRRAGGAQRLRIALADLVAGSDVAWVRGHADDVGALVADSVEVRAAH